MKIEVSKIAFLLVTLGICANSRASYQAPLTPSMAKPDFSEALINQSLDVGIDLRKLDLRRGVHVVPLEQSWATGEQAQAIRRQIAEQSSKGFYTVEPDQVVDMRASSSMSAMSSGPLYAHDRAFASLDEVLPRLAVTPVALGDSRLTLSMLDKVYLAGGLVNGRWTGVTRTFEVPGLGFVILDETNYVAGGESVSIVEEWLNVDIRGRRGTARTARADNGKVRVLVGWSDDRKLYSLQLEPLHPEAIVDNQATLVALANGLGQ